ncbi:unnamed protein product [Ixodes persulcatus]
MQTESECLYCLKPLTKDCVSLTCHECKHQYHSGKCSGVTKKSFKQMSPQKIETWQCNTCITHKKRQSRKMNVQGGKNDSIIMKLEQNGKTIDVIEKSLDHLSSQYDELLKKTENQSRTIEELSKKTNRLEALVVERDEEIQSLKLAVDNAEQYSRRNNIEIHGVKQVANENLTHIIESIAVKLDLPPPKDQSVEAVHRLHSKEGKTAPILVRFSERNTRDMWIKKRVTLRSEGIYINKNLTKLLKSLFWSTRTRAKEKQYKFVWVRNGKIFVRQKEGASVIRVESEKDLSKIS